MTWRILSPQPTQVLGDDPEALSMEIDPRTSVIRLGISPLGATTQEADGGAILLRYLPGSHADWRPVATWLQEPQAQAYLQQISSGYAAEQRWSGDWQASWSEDAWTAASALHEGVAHILAQAQGQ